MSRIISSSATSSTSLMVASAFSENSLATTTSLGSGMFTLVIKSLAFSSKSASYKDLPTGKPAAAKKVLAMPPPTIIWSHFSDKANSTSSLLETLEPPTIATNGLAGWAKAFSNASNSAANKGPAQATGAKRATPWVEAWARWAVPKASMTNTSQSAA